jgi:hypothetical protein
MSGVVEGNIIDINWGPLSLIKYSHTPNCRKTSFSKNDDNTIAVFVREAWVTMYLVKQSVITNKNTFPRFEQGKEPISIMEIIFHGR